MGYTAAFGVFAELSSDVWAAEPWSTLPVAPFRLRHDTSLVERLVRVGRIDANDGKRVVTGLRKAFAMLNSEGRAESHVHDLPTTSGKKSSSQDELWWIRTGDLNEHILRELRAGEFDQLHRLYPYPLT